MPDVLWVVVITLLAGSATGIGAIPIVLAPQINQHLFDTLIGFSAGVLLGAAAFALLLPAFSMGSSVTIGIGLVSGYLFLTGVGYLLLQQNQPSQQSIGTDSESLPSSHRAFLIGGTVTLHNIPEGLAVGIAFAIGAESVAIVLALAIGIQNISDGFIVAIAAHDTDLSNRSIILYTTLTGAIPEPIAAFIGYTLATSVESLFPVTAAFAAGVMFAVVYTELIPLYQRHGNGKSATLALISGIILLFLLEQFI